MASPDVGEFPDWTSLPLDILGSIAERLPVMDYFRFPAIAKDFASAIAGKLFLPPVLKSPLWLLLQPSADNGDAKDDTIIFFDVSTRQTFSIRHPNFYGRRWVASGAGWLASLENEDKLILLNPFRGSQITFPSLDTIPRFNYIRHHRPDAINHLRVKALACENDTSDGSSFMIAVICVGGLLAFAKEGSNNWISLDNFLADNEDMVYHQGKLYCLHSNSSIETWDFTGASPKRDVLSERTGAVDADTNDLHLAICHGELFQFWLDIIWRRHSKVFKFNVEEQRWQPVEGLGDHAIFVGNNSEAISTSHVQGIGKGHVYFTQEGWDGFYLCHLQTDNGKIEKHYLESSKNKWKHPLWFKHNLI